MSFSAPLSVITCVVSSRCCRRLYVLSSASRSKTTETLFVSSDTSKGLPEHWDSKNWLLAWSFLSSSDTRKVSRLRAGILDEPWRRWKHAKDRRGSHLFRRKRIFLREAERHVVQFYKVTGIVIKIPMPLRQPGTTPIRAETSRI